VALIQAVRAVLVLGLVLVLTGALGTVGAALAIVISQAVVAALISVGLWRVLTGDHVPRARRAREVAGR